MKFRPAVIALVLLLQILQSLVAYAQNVNTTLRSKRSFSGQTLANVWGYVVEGKEYALVGGSKGLIILDITNPDAPVQIVQIPGPDNLWKEIKTYQNYAYVVSEGGNGIQIVNLANLPSATLANKYYRGDGAILNQLNRIHALHIDETKGFLYAWGGDLFSGAGKIFDLKQDPWNPVYVGKFDQLGYIHDGYVDNDTMYSGHIYNGQFAIVNMADKSAPQLINTQTTPGAFTHNTWLADDRRTILATDEVNNSYLSAWDVSDPTNIKFLDRIQSNPGSGSMVHNTYVRGNWAITSWYKDGFTIVDITRPDNLVQVGNYDTYPQSGGGSEGCWGVYHNFPSGNIIASNINPGDLFIVTPNYIRACYLEGMVTSATTGLPIQNAQVEVLNANSTVVLQEKTVASGVYKIGQTEEGYFKVRVSRSGYQTYETYVYLQHGEVITLDVALYPNGLKEVQGTVVSYPDSLPLKDATVWLYGEQTFEYAATDSTGAFNFSNIPPGKYDVAASAPDLSMGLLASQSIVSDTVLYLVTSNPYRREALRLRNGEAASAEYLQIGQNPFVGETRLSWCAAANEGLSIAIQNTEGRILQTFTPVSQNGQIQIGATLPAGVYFVVLRQAEQVLSVRKIVKAN